MLRAVSGLLLLQASALALSLVKDEQVYKGTDAAEAVDATPDADGLDRASFTKATMGNPMRQIDAKSSPFYTAKQARKFKLAYDEYLAHPIVKRYMTKNNLMGVVPEKKVQREMLENILPPLSPYAKLGFLSFHLPPHVLPNENDNLGKFRRMRENSESLQDIKKFLEEEMKDKLECVLNFWKILHKSDVTLHDNHLHPYDGFQMWVMINTNNTQVRELVIDHTNNVLKEILPKGVKDLDAQSSALWQFLPVMSEGTFLIAREKKKFSVGDIGKNIIISNQHGIASGYVEVKPDPEEEGEMMCSASRKDILFEAELAPMSRTTRFVHMKIFQTWTPTWQRFNYMIHQLRNQDGKVLTSRFQEFLADPNVNQDCKVTENKVQGGKTWETRCILGKDTLKWISEKTKEHDKNSDGEMDFDEYMALSDDVWSTFQPTAPAYTPPIDGSVRRSLKDYVDDWWNDQI